MFSKHLHIVEITQHYSAVMSTYAQRLELINVWIKKIVTISCSVLLICGGFRLDTLSICVYNEVMVMEFMEPPPSQLS